MKETKMREWSLNTKVGGKNKKYKGIGHLPK
jgi:hypothetical protein